MSQPPSSQRPIIAAALRIYRGLLHLYPRAFRQRFADEMAQVFGTTCEEAQAQRGRWAVAMLLLLAVPDVLITASRVRLASTEITGGNIMNARTWATLGSIMALVALASNISNTVFTVSHQGSAFFLGAVMPDGLRLLGHIATLFVLVGLLLAQRTGAGRLLGGMALLGTVMSICFVEIWQVFLVLNGHPRIYSLVAPLGGWAWMLGLVGSVGLGITTVRSQALGRWSSMPLLWQVWAIFGSLGILVSGLVFSAASSLLFIYIASLLIALPTWVFLVGTAIGLWQAAHTTSAPTVIAVGTSQE